MKLIKKYIQFAIDNNLKIDNEDVLEIYSKQEEQESEVLLLVGKIITGSNVTELITSKKFIEAIAKGIDKEKFFIDNSLFNYFWSTGKITTIEAIIIQQALAIANKELDKFIKQILGIKHK